jgi:hypothetical protein
MTIDTGKKVEDTGGRKALVINPPVEDPHVWGGVMQPYGLIKIASYLKNVRGYNVQFIDALMPSGIKGTHTMDVPRTGIGFKQFGTRKVKMWRWGQTREELMQSIAGGFTPDEIYVGGTLTFHYKTFKETLGMCRSIFPDATLVAGGIYPTLCPEHAEQWDVDLMVKGDYYDIELGEVTRGCARDVWADFDLLSYTPDYAMLSTSCGCPLNCSFCAIHQLRDKIWHRDSADVVAEIVHIKKRWGIKKFVLADDNIIMVRGGKHFDEILDGIINRKLKILLELHEGLSAHRITEELIIKMHKAGMRDIYLGYESSDPELLKQWHKKETPATIRQVVEWAYKHGFRSGGGVNLFLLYGLPKQTMSSMVSSLMDIMDMCCRPIPQNYTPIPGTEEYDKDKEFWDQFDLEDLNGRFYPASYMSDNPLTQEDYHDYLALVNTIRKAIHLTENNSPHMDFAGNSSVARALREYLSAFPFDRVHDARIVPAYTGRRSEKEPEPEEVDKAQHKFDTWTGDLSEMIYEGEDYGEEGKEEAHEF